MVETGLLDRGLGGGCARRREQFPQGAAGEQDAMGVMDDAVEDRVPEGGVPDQIVPVLDRDLAGEEGGPSSTGTKASAMPPSAMRSWIVWSITRTASPSPEDRFANSARTPRQTPRPRNDTHRSHARTITPQRPGRNGPD